MPFDDTLEKHRIAGVSLRKGICNGMRGRMHGRVKLVIRPYRDGSTSTPARKPSRNRWDSACTGMSEKWNVISGQRPFRDTPRPTH